MEQILEQTIIQQQTTVDQSWKKEFVKNAINSTSAFVQHIMDKKNIKEFTKRNLNWVSFLKFLMILKNYYSEYVEKFEIHQKASEIYLFFFSLCFVFNPTLIVFFYLSLVSWLMISDVIAQWVFLEDKQYFNSTYFALSMIGIGLQYFMIYGFLTMIVFVSLTYFYLQLIINNVSPKVYLKDLFAKISSIKIKQFEKKQV